MEYQTNKGFLYAVTGGEDGAEITDSNGLTLSIEAGQQVLFTATSNSITVTTGTITLTQVR